MPHSPRRIAVFGATGSIGQSTLDVVRHSAGRLKVVALSSHRKLDALCRQAQEFEPQLAIATDENAARKFAWPPLPRTTELLAGPRGLERAARLAEVDIVLAAIVGSAGLASTWAALEAGKMVALANKETLVMAGPQVMRLSRERNAKIIPVDSEHSAVFQLIGSHHAPRDDGISRSEMPTKCRRDIKRIILTASGGPFRQWTRSEMQQATVADALAHPTWKMGEKITIDSATMMNKALEIIEARWLFDLEPRQIDVVIHPQSIVHSLVEFVDGSVTAQLSPPDMKLPIQYALDWPERHASPARRLDLTQNVQLEFEPPDEDRFPALPLGREVAAAGGTAGAVLNAANEAAVASFLAGELQFVEIVPACRAVLESHTFDPSPSLEELLRLDRWARQEISRWTCA